MPSWDFETLNSSSLGLSKRTNNLQRSGNTMLPTAERCRLQLDKPVEGRIASFKNLTYDIDVASLIFVPEKFSFKCLAIASPIRSSSSDWTLGSA